MKLIIGIYSVYANLFKILLFQHIMSMEDFNEIVHIPFCAKSETSGVCFIPTTHLDSVYRQLQCSMGIRSWWLPC